MKQQTMDKKSAGEQTDIISYKEFLLMPLKSLETSYQSTLEDAQLMAKSSKEHFEETLKECKDITHREKVVNKEVDSLFEILSKKDSKDLLAYLDVKVIADEIETIEGKSNEELIYELDESRRMYHRSIGELPNKQTTYPLNQAFDLNKKYLIAIKQIWATQFYYDLLGSPIQDEKAIDINEDIIDGLVDQLSSFFDKADHENLKLVLSGVSINKPLCFSGNANQLAHVFRQLKNRDDLLTQELVQQSVEDICNWLASNFCIGNDQKPINPDSASQVMSREYSGVKENKIIDLSPILIQFKK